MSTRNQTISSASEGEADTANTSSTSCRAAGQACGRRPRARRPGSAPPTSASSAGPGGVGRPCAPASAAIPTSTLIVAASLKDARRCPRRRSGRTRPGGSPDRAGGVGRVQEADPFPASRPAARRASPRAAATPHQGRRHQQDGGGAEEANQRGDGERLRQQQVGGDVEVQQAEGEREASAVRPTRISAAPNQANGLRARSARRPAARAAERESCHAGEGRGGVHHVGAEHGLRGHNQSTW